jgi:glycosyltransferase involved in cell wall biosynthesis
MDRIIATLDSLSDPETGNKLIYECYPRQQIYNGPFKDRFPDIMFTLDPQYGLHWSIHDDLIITDYAHKLVSGGHSRDAVFLLSREAIEPLLTVLETFASGVPVMATDTHSINEAVVSGKKGIIVAGGNYRGFIDGALQLLETDENNWCRWSLEARKMALDNFSIASVSRRLAAMHCSFLNS